ncbi:hypothetical protein F4776DRAFT_606730 [Hypoxylon sp. NC0597]|nr:hypothetical protein F4776DRAFT_606730 [Hypoxylon sp. NC0597]
MIDAIDVEDMDRQLIPHDEFIRDGIRNLLTRHGLETEVKAYTYDNDLDEEILEHYSHWRVEEDMSVREDRIDLPGDWTNKYSWAGVEVISPVELDIPAAFAAINYARKLLTSTYRCRVNPSAGFHVHVGQGAERFPLQSMRRIASLVWSAENLLVTLNHPSRPANYYSRALRNRSRLSRGRESGDGPDHERIPRKFADDLQHGEYAGRPLNEPKLCLDYLASDLRHGEELISWREMEENNGTENILAFLETRKEGCFDPFFLDKPESGGDSGSSGKTLGPAPRAPEKQIDGVLSKARSLDKEIAFRVAEVSGSGLETESPREILRSRTIPRIKNTHYTIEQLREYSQLYKPYGGGGLSWDNLPEDPGVWEGVSQFFQSPSSCDIEYLTHPGSRGYVSFRSYNCLRTIDLNADRTIEFRGAEGTLGGWIITWAKICLGLVKFALRASPAEFIRIINNCDIGEREDGVFDIIDLLDAIGLPEEAAAAEKRIEQNKEAWNIEYVEVKK